jgi:membrane protease YdiL (CAAX protease family)
VAWFLIGPVLAIGGLVFCAAFAWLVFGEGSANWFTQHALVLNEALAQVPASASPTIRFWIVTLPAMIFSPLAEEFLYRGFMLTAFSMRWGYRKATSIQATAFALVHLAHYGLHPLQPALVSVWLPSMFFAALAFGWIVQKSGSIWSAVVSHIIFNLGMNGMVFLLLPGLVGV